MERGESNEGSSAAPLEVGIRIQWVLQPVLAAVRPPGASTWLYNGQQGATFAAPVTYLINLTKGDTNSTFHCRVAIEWIPVSDENELVMVAKTKARKATKDGATLQR